jgi:hypothetical protein
MPKLNYLFLIFSFISIFCSEPDPVTSMSEEDTRLKSSLIGGWGYRYFHEIYFNANNTFALLRYYIFIDCYNDCPNSPPYTKITGHYYVHDGILTLYDIQLSNESQSKDLLEYEPIDLEIERIDSIFISSPVDILTKKDKDDNSLYGTWELEKWLSVWQKVTPDMYLYEGYVQDTYTFAKDSSKLFYNRHYFNNRSIPDREITGNYRTRLDTLEIQYPKNITLQTAEAKRTFKIKNNRLFWYYPNSTQTLPRLK